MIPCDGALAERMTLALERQAMAMELVAQRVDLLIQHLAGDDPDDPDAEPQAYMDGTPIKGGA